MPLPPFGTTIVHSVTGFVCGRVQGVGFRYFVHRLAASENLVGYAVNLADGRVEFLLQGDADAVARVIERIRTGPAYARVSGVELEAAQDLPPRQGFTTR